MDRRWRLIEVEPSQVRRVAEGLRVPSFLARLLVARGIREPAQARAFLAPALKDLEEPEAIPGTMEAAGRIVQAVQQGKKICVYGDYDADGVCATAILYGCLRLCGARVEYYIPRRIEEGYGLNCEALEWLRTEQGVDVVVTVDCGIRSLEAARKARELGIELIVTDHHRFGDDLPDAEVIVHPRLGSDGAACRDLCGAGVALKLCWAIARLSAGKQRVPPRYRDFLLEALLYAAVATIADVVPLTGENRVIVRHGLKLLQKGAPVGLRELMRVAAVEPENGVDAETVAFRLAPRLNAVGRLGHARHAVELLLARSPEPARELATYLHDLNRQRQSLEGAIYREAVRLLEDAHDLETDLAIVLGSQSWHPGIVGIVAARIAQRFYRPTVLVTLSQPIAQGSGRSIPGYDLCDAVEACAEHLEGFGGHAAAVGVKLRPASLGAFRRALCAHAAATLDGADLRRTIRIDAEASLGELSLGAVRWLEAMGPFGQGNPRPHLLSTDVELVSEPRVVGESQRHVMLRFRQHSTTLGAIAFSMAERIGELEAGARYDIVYTPQINWYQGYSSVRLQLVDFRRCSV